MRRVPGLWLVNRLVLAAVGLGVVAGSRGPRAELPNAGGELLREYCGACHCDGGAEGGIDLDQLLDTLRTCRPAGDSAEEAAWVAIWRNLQAETMPPADESKPDAGTRAALVSFVLGDVLGVDPERPDPGRVVLRRLNRVEYGNTIRDLTGFTENVTDDLPPDDTGYGFDTIGDVLSLSPLLLEKYLDLAARVADHVVAESSRGASGLQAGVNRPWSAGSPPGEPAAREAFRRTLIQAFAERAFRRPVDPPTLDRLAAVAVKAEAAAAGAFEAGISAAVTAILASPRFLFRVEETDQSAADAPADAAVPIDDYSLATRLSYFLWSTLPDDELFGLATAGRLRAELPSQVERMLADPRSDAFVTNFVGQWLQTRDVESKAVDVEGLYRNRGWDSWRLARLFSWEVREAMRQETELLFAHVLRERLPATDLLVAPITFLNEPLARFYGIDGVSGPEMRLVDIAGESGRGGLLSHGSILLVTSNPNRTSPVKRGLFVLDNLLGTPPPPPPPSVPPLEQAAAGAGEAATMRELMERHRADPGCAACHARMDPLGLALEQYDAVGRFRRGEEGEGIDTAGQLITGERFQDARELAALIAGPRRRDFHRCLVEKMLTYAIGRGLEYSDAPAVDIIMESLEADGRLIDAVQGVVASVPFQMRRAADPAPSSAPPEAEP
ncbi:MAG: hypothetical protein RLZZ440_1410 [Planctomycetota bacterium]